MLYKFNKNIEKSEIWSGLESCFSDDDDFYYLLAA